MILIIRILIGIKYKNFFGHKKQKINIIYLKVELNIKKIIWT